MRKPDIQQLIISILSAQDYVQFAGGTSRNSDIYKSLIKNMKVLFAFYGIDFVKSNISLAFAQPYDPRNCNITDVCDVVLCLKKESKQFWQLNNEIINNFNLIRDYQPFNVNKRAIIVARNLAYMINGDDFY